MTNVRATDPYDACPATNDPDAACICADIDADLRSRRDDARVDRERDRGIDDP